MKEKHSLPVRIVGNATLAIHAMAAVGFIAVVVTGLLSLLGVRG